jgi:hypothetical protein
MRRIGAVAVGLATAGVLVTSACTARNGDSAVPDQSAVTRSTNEALALLARTPLRGFRAEPVASGHDRADDQGLEISESVKGRALFQVACSGEGDVTVTLPRQHTSQVVTCGEPATGFTFRRQLVALVVGARISTGAYAWRILPAS